MKSMENKMDDMNDMNKKNLADLKKSMEELFKE